MTHLFNYNSVCRAALIFPVSAYKVDNFEYHTDRQTERGFQGFLKILSDLMYVDLPKPPSPPISGVLRDFYSLGYLGSS